MPRPTLDLRDALLLSWGCVCTGRIWPLPCVKQRQDSVCELDFTRHQMRCSRVEIGSQSSFLLVPSSSPLLLPPRWVDVLIKRGSACSPLSCGAWDHILGLASLGSLTICINVYLTNREPSYIPPAFVVGLVGAVSLAEAFLGCLLCAWGISNPQKKPFLPEE